MDTVVAINHHKNAGHDETPHVFPLTSMSGHVGEHRQRKHHGCYCHVSAGPTLEVVVATGKIRDHLPPLAEFAYGILQRNQILVSCP